MSFDLASLVRRIESLEKAQVRLEKANADLQDAFGALRLALAASAGGGLGEASGDSELVIAKPNGAIGMATYSAAVNTPGDVGYVPPRLVPATGAGKVWALFSATTGELRLRESVRRWDDVEEEYVQEAPSITIDNFNDAESIPATARYVVCRRHGGRHQALVWHCGT